MYCQGWAAVSLYCDAWGLRSAVPTLPFRGILGCPRKGRPTHLALVFVSTGNGGHSGTEGLGWGQQGREGAVTVEKGPGQMGLRATLEAPVGSAPPVSSAGSAAV